MVGLILASHGEFCNGLRDSVEMLAGTIENCETCPYQLGVYPDAYDDQLVDAIERVDQGDGILIFCDLKGGTPYNRAVMQARDNNIYVVYGANVPALLTTVLSRFEEVPLAELADIAATAASGADSVGVTHF